MDNQEDMDGSSPPRQFIPLHRPLYNRSQNSAVAIRQNRTSRAPRPHSIGASIISNPKLVKGWEYYDNSPNKKSIRKYLSTINVPCEEIDSSDGGGGGSDSRGGTYASSNNCSPYRDSYRRGVGVIGPDEEEGDDYVAGVEVQACVATDSDLDDDEEEDDDSGNWGRWRPFLGIIFAMIASSAFGLSSVLVTSLPQDPYKQYPFSVSVWMFQGILLPSLAIYLLSLCRVQRVEKDTISIIIQQTTSFKKKIGIALLILIRALFGWLGVVLTVYSQHYMNVSEADFTIIRFLTPVFVGVAAWCYLKEKMGLITFLTTGMILIGVGVMARPPLLMGKAEFDRDQLIGASTAVGCMLLGVFSIMILRYIRDIHFALITSIFGLVGTIGGLLLCFVRDGGFQFPHSATDWVKAGSIVGLTFVGHNLMTIALKYEEAVIFALVLTWESPISLLWKFLIFEKRPDLLSLIGALLVVLGVLIVIARKWIQSLPKSKRMRRWCRCLLI